MGEPQFTDGTDKYTVLETLRDTLKMMRRLPGGRENSLAITKLEEAIMWLDKA